MSKSQDANYRKHLRETWKRSGLTQSEFAKTLPVNPKTGKPYNARTIRKIMSGERGVQHFRQAESSRTSVFVQRFVQNGQTFSQRVEKPAGISITELDTPKGKRAVRQAIKAAIQRKGTLRGSQRSFYLQGYEATLTDDFELADRAPAKPRGMTRAITETIHFS